MNENIYLMRNLSIKPRLEKGSQLLKNIIVKFQQRNLLKEREGNFQKWQENKIARLKYTDTGYRA